MFGFQHQIDQGNEESEKENENKNHEGVRKPKESKPIPNIK